MAAPHWSGIKVILYMYVCSSILPHFVVFYLYVYFNVYQAKVMLPTFSMLTIFMHLCSLFYLYSLWPITYKYILVFTRPMLLMLICALCAPMLPFLFFTLSFCALYLSLAASQAVFFFLLTLSMYFIIYIYIQYPYLNSSNSFFCFQIFCILSFQCKYMLIP